MALIDWHGSLVFLSLRFHFDELDVLHKHDWIQSSFQLQFPRIPTTTDVNLITM